MKPYLKQNVTLWTQDREGGEQIEPPEGYYLAFAELRGDLWALLWAPMSEPETAPEGKTWCAACHEWHPPFTENNKNPLEAAANNPLWTLPR